MASKELSILLLARDMASKTIGKVSREVGGLGKTSRTAGAGLSTLSGNMAKLGAVAAVGIGAMVTEGVSSLESLESATSAVTGAINQVGLKGKVTGGQVATWANEIEASVGAAFDDKDILASSAALIRYGKVSKDNLRPAMVVMTDLAAKTGSVDSAALLLGKALADPEKAAGKLARSGVVLTKSQQDQIKAMVKAGKTAEAQAFLLEQLEKTTKGAAAASQGPYKRALSTLADVTEDAQRALAEGFLPVIEKVAKWLSTKFADPKVIADIRSFGGALAGAFDKALAFTQKIPWDSVKDAMTMAGKGAKAAFDMFTAMPPWVQTAVITGWGLNKLTGGAVGSIISQLGSGLIKGVLGMNAAVVNINAGIVNGGGGLPGGGKGGLPGVPAAVGAAETGWAAGGVAGLAAIAASIVGSAAVAAAIIGIENRVTGTTSADIATRNTRGQFGPRTAAQHNATDISLRPLPIPVGEHSALGPALVAQRNATINAELTAIGPGAAGVYQRAVAAGLHPSVASVAGTLAKNVAAAKAAAVAASKTTAAVFAGAERTGGRLLGVQATIAGKNYRPNITTMVTVPVSVTNTVSVRDTVARLATFARYGKVRAL